MKKVTKKKGLLAHKGFTLIELLIVIVIIGILAGILIAVIDPRTQQNRARDANVRSAINKLALHVGSYVSAYGVIPDDIEFQSGLQNSGVAGTYAAAADDAQLTFNLTNSLLDAVTGSLIGLSFALIGSIILFDYFPGLLPIFILLQALNILGFALFIKKRRGSKFFTILVRPLIPKKYRERFDKSIEGFYEDIPRVRDLIIPLIIEIFIWIIIATEVYIIGMAFSIDSYISYPVFILVHSISIVAIGLIPISIGGLGIREGAFVILLLAFGVKQEIAFVVSLAGLIVKLVIPSIVGMIIAFRETR